MIESIYVDNYKCLANAEIDLKSLNLFLGDNGTGKAAVFEVLSIIKELSQNPMEKRERANFRLARRAKQLYPQRYSDVAKHCEAEMQPLGAPEVF